MSFVQKLVVARVLNRYVGQSPLLNCNRALIAAIEKWIGAEVSKYENRSIRPLRV